METKHILVCIVLAALGWCLWKWHTYDYRDVVADAITEQYVEMHIKPKVNLVVHSIEMGKLPNADELKKLGVVTIQTVPKSSLMAKLWRNGNIYEDVGLQPKSNGMITGVQNADNVGLYYPEKIDSPIVQIRYNSSKNKDLFIAVHVLAPNPLLK